MGEDAEVERPCLTEQLAELVVSLLALDFPFSSEGHRGDAWWVEAREQRC